MASGVRTPLHSFAARGRTVPFVYERSGGGASQANWGTRQRDLLEQYIADFAVLHSDNSLCSWWAEVKTESRQKGRPMGSADAWIAATALALSVPLVTNNAKDYQHLDGLQIVSLTPA